MAVSKRTGAENIRSAFEELLAEKPADEITVSEVAQKAGVSRRTFYYHYEDIASLMKDDLLLHLRETVGSSNIPDYWTDGFERIIRNTKQNQDRVMHMYHSGLRNDFILSLNHFADQILFKAATLSAQDYGVQISESDKILVAHYYRYIFVGILVQYIEDGMKENPDQIIHDCRRLMDWSLIRTIRQVISTR